MVVLVVVVVDVGGAGSLSGLLSSLSLLSSSGLTGNGDTAIQVNGQHVNSWGCNETDTVSLSGEIPPIIKSDTMSHV